eukprot:CAMPEP_0116565626 /NCGR_PEP_ID=MMETSP0397-20121206/14002_1 /TAXON_ID=216820 /ORGANISM="Cyclophora tenuis, Strain ECT3854" /LENGTH=126 /DNA_ID=CAMNT_0004092419 /DNA_START=44 /DNA_END=424 /DNA_ORIENTATION=-
MPSNRRVVRFTPQVVSSIVKIPNIRNDDEAKGAMFYSKTELKAFMLIAKQEAILRSMIRKMKKIRQTVASMDRLDVVTCVPPSTPSPTTTSFPKRKRTTTDMNTVHIIPDVQSDDEFEGPAPKRRR